jgi:O-antigen/teichoic acid export membrane protein
MNKGIIVQVGVKFSATFISLVWTVYFARLVDVAVRGEVVFIMGILVVLISVMTFGSPALITKGISSSKLVVADSHLISMVLSVIVCIPCSVTFILLAGIDGIALNLYFVIAIYCQIFFTYQQSILFSLKKQLAVYAIEFVAKAIGFSIYMLTDRGVTSYYVCFFGSFIISSLLVLYSFRLGCAWTNILAFIKNNLRDGALLFAINLSIYLLMKSDILVMGVGYSNYHIGIYSVALSFCDFLMIFNSIIGNMFFPKISSIPKTEDKKLLLKKYLSNLLLLYIGGAAIMFLISDFLITSTFGDKYLESSEVLNILFVSYVFLSLIAICNNYMASIGIRKTMIIVVLFVLLSKVSLIFLFKDAASLMAIAYINLACSLFLLTFYIVYVFRKI